MIDVGDDGDVANLLDDFHKGVKLGTEKLAEDPGKDKWFRGGRAAPA
jgi:hypothetical protein